MKNKKLEAFLPAEDYTQDVRRSVMPEARLFQRLRAFSRLIGALKKERGSHVGQRTQRGFATVKRMTLLLVSGLMNACF